ncbi:L-threonine ammonia-lyase [Staphylothermus marinus F1]|uniref:threonine ammonia-lyase n=1 Tax=Staphylothermus marinus (strain ATCC 43588 / DSM 3639 / JCM 9404 / F1) TaxID=399550 RepID=A3DLX2_STAMF|nr:threonine ammonia-lyase [Staphylothermus marinus]ABN69632.1 L-threonine ammonia-lyase [Staphylothermus marinus F1]
MIITPGESFSSDIENIYKLSLEASEVIQEFIHKTPLVYNYTISNIVGCDTYLKLENMQKTGSFKVRGATFKIYMLIKEYESRGEKLPGVVAASSGNHAQGVAYAAKVFGIPAIIVMPKTASSTKINATKSYGAEVVLHGEIYDEAYEKAIEISREKGYVFIHPYDDPYIIAGQATIGHEIIDELKKPVVVLVPIGGGGLISGIAVAVKKRSPNTKIIGVQPANASAMLHLIQGRIEGYRPKPSIADGVMVKKPGDLTSRIVRELVDDIVVVDEEDISYAINFLLERAKIVAEGAGALPIAALLSHRYSPIRGPVVAVISGGNIDPALLSRIIMHELAKDKRLLSIIGELWDKPGELGKVISVLAKHNLNIIDIRHDRWDPRLLPSKAKLEIVFEAKTSEDVELALVELERIGYRFRVKG